MIRFLVKAGLATTAVIYIRDKGVWKDSSESVKTIQQIQTSVSPYVKQIKEVVPFEAPQVSSFGSFSFSGCWNKAVLASFQFISNVPEHCQQLTDKVIENAEVKKFLESFSSSPKADAKK